MEKNYRSTNKAVERDSYFERAMEEEFQFTIWQKERGVDRPKKITATISKKFGPQNTLFFKASADEVRFSNDEEVFVFGNSEECLFKSKVRQFGPEMICLTVPSEIQLPEKRLAQRTYFAPEDHKKVEIEFFTKTNQKFIVNSELLNISESGACFILSKDTFSKINIDKGAFIRNIDSLEGKNGKKAKLMNARKYKARTLCFDDFFAIGIMFSEDIED